MLNYLPHFFNFYIAHHLAAITIQSLVRGYFVRNINKFHKMKNSKEKSSISKLSAKFLRLTESAINTDQSRSRVGFRNWCASRIQVYFIDYF